MQNLWSRLQSQQSEACLPQWRIETESPISPDPSLFCTSSWFFWVQCSSFALYCLLCIVLQHSNIIFVLLKNNSYALCCFNAYVVNKFDDNEHCSCSCSDWAVCDIKRGRFTIRCFGTMLKVEGLEKRLGLGLARSRSRLVAKIRRLGLVELQDGLGLGLVSDRKPNALVSSRSHKLKSRLHPWDEGRMKRKPGHWFWSVFWHRWLGDS